MSAMIGISWKMEIMRKRVGGIGGSSLGTVQKSRHTFQKFRIENVKCLWNVTSMYYKRMVYCTDAESLENE